MMRLFIRAGLITVVALIGSVLRPHAATAATYHVAKTGSDANSCVQAQNSSTAKLTIGAGLACIGTAAGAGAGHTVEVAAGTYTEAIRNSLPSGTSWSSPFTLKVKAGDVVTIRATDESNIYQTAGSSLWTIISGFVLDGTNLSNNQVTINGPGFIRLTNLDIVNTTNWSGIYTGYSGNLEILNNKIHDGTFLPSGFGHALYIEGSDNLIEGNELYNLAAFGVHNYSTAGNPSNNIVRKNKVYNFGLQRETATGILLTSGSGNQAYNNIVFNGQGSLGDGGVGIAIGGCINCKVYNNTVYNNTWIGIDINNSTNALVKNNIIYQNLVTFFGSGTGSVVTNNLTTDPNFVNAAAQDFHLQSGSPAIDTGVTVTEVPNDFDLVVRPQGSAYDIGAYEFIFNLNSLNSPTNLQVTIP